MGRTHTVRKVAVGLALLALGSEPGLAAGPPARTTPIVVRVDDRGFGWTEAGLGVVAGAGAALAAVGAAALVRPHTSGQRQPGKEQPHDDHR